MKTASDPDPSAAQVCRRSCSRMRSSDEYDNPVYGAQTAFWLTKTRTWGLGAPFLTAVTGQVPTLRFAVEGVRETQKRGARRGEGGVGPTAVEPSVQSQGGHDAGVVGGPPRLESLDVSVPDDVGLPGAHRPAQEDQVDAGAQLGLRVSPTTDLRCSRGRRNAHVDYGREGGSGGKSRGVRPQEPHPSTLSAL